MFTALKTLVALVACAALTTCSDSGANVDDRSVILITLDTTRCDALGAFGGKSETTPNLDALAARSVRYLQARTVAPLTLPAHSSMFTGLYPPRHTVRGNGPTILPGEATTLAERAASAGFQTAGFIGGLTLDRAYGAAQGFETWTQPEQSPLRIYGAISDRPAHEVVSDARRWLKARDRKRPFFLWVHVFDAHAPYAPPQRFLQQGGGDPYLGEIASSDAALAELFADFERERLLEHALLLVCADHGESRNDHEEETHGLEVWDTTLHVPFFIHYPQRNAEHGNQASRAGETSTETISVVDVFPTLLEAMHLEVPRDLDGMSLFHKSVDVGRGVYFESLSGWARFGWSPLVGWCDARGKYIHCSAPQFFDVRTDAGETQDLFSERAADIPRYRAAIEAVLAKPALLVLQQKLVASSAARAVAELGYSAGSDEFVPEYPNPLAPNDRPAPRHQIAEYRAFEKAQALAQEEKYTEAVAILEPLVADNPWNIHAMDELGADLVELKQWQRAIDVLNERATHPPDRLSIHKNLVRCYTELGELAKAREHSLRALELLIESYERSGDHVQAQRFRTLYENEVGKTDQ